MCTHRVAIKTIKEKESARFAIFASVPTKGEYNNHYAVPPSELADCRFIETIHAYSYPANYV